MNRGSNQSGVTLIEMMIVVSIIGLMAAISFPSVASGLDSLRLTSASESIVSFLNSGMNRAQRRQEGVEITISKTENAIMMRSPDPAFQRRLQIPEGVVISKIYPETPGIDEPARSYILYPGGTVPRFGIDIANKRGRHRIVRVDPITGIPQVEQ